MSPWIAIPLWYAAQGAVTVLVFSQPGALVDENNRPKTFPRAAWVVFGARWPYFMFRWTTNTFGAPS